MKITFYDILSDILLKKSGKLDEESNFNQVFSTFMIIRYLSMKTNLIPYATKLNEWQGLLSNKTVYKYLYNNIPKQSSGYITYIKKIKKKK